MTKIPSGGSGNPSLPGNPSTKFISFVKMPNINTFECRLNALYSTSKGFPCINITNTKGINKRTKIKLRGATFYIQDEGSKFILTPQVKPGPAQSAAVPRIEIREGIKGTVIKIGNKPAFRIYRHKIEGQELFWVQKLCDEEIIIRIGEDAPDRPKTMPVKQAEIKPAVKSKAQKELEEDPTAPSMDLARRLGVPSIADMASKLFSKTEIENRFKKFLKEALANKGPDQSSISFDVYMNSEGKLEGFGLFKDQYPEIQMRLNESELYDLKLEITVSDAGSGPKFKLTFYTDQKKKITQKAEDALKAAEEELNKAPDSYIEQQKTGEAA